MDAVLSVVGSSVLQGLTVSCDNLRGGITADGYVPKGARGSRRLPSKRPPEGVLRNEHDSAGSEGVVTVLAGLGIQLAGIAAVLYMSARVTNYMMKLKERELQQSVKNLLRAKLPGRHDLDIDSLQLNSHEISVVSVGSSLALECVPSLL